MNFYFFYFFKLVFSHFFNDSLRLSKLFCFSTITLFFLLCRQFRYYFFSLGVYCLFSYNFVYLPLFWKYKRIKLLYFGYLLGLLIQFYVFLFSLFNFLQMSPLAKFSTENFILSKQIAISFNQHDNYINNQV